MLKNTQKLLLLLAAQVSGQMYADYINQLGPVAWWRLREASGSTAVNTINNSLNGSISGAVGLGQEGALGSDEAFSFDGSSGLVTVPNDTGIANLSTQSWAALIKASSLGEGNNGSIFNWGAGTGGSHHNLRLASSNRLVSSIAGSSVTANTRSTNDWMLSRLNTWLWVFATFDGVEIVLYAGQNGAVSLIPTSVQTELSGSVVAQTGSFYIGNNSSQAMTFNGLIDELLIFDAVLTNEQMTQITQLSGV